MRRANPLGFEITPQGEGGAAGSIAGSFLPFPGGSQIGGIIGSILGGLIGGKPSNDTAYAWFTAGPVPQPMPGGVSGKACQSNVCGDEKTPQTTTAAAQATQYLVQLIAAASAQGITFSSPAFVLTMGGRDPSGILHADHSGQWYQQAIGNPMDAAGAARGAFLWLAQFASQPLTAPAAPPQGNVIQSQPPPSGAAQSPAIGATDPLPGGMDYQSQTSAPAAAADPAAAGGTDAPVVAGFPPILWIAIAVVGVAVVFGSEK